MALQFTTSYVEDSITIFRYYKRLVERALEQVSDEQLLATLDQESNSIAVIVKHMIGEHAVALDRFSDQRRRETGP